MPNERLAHFYENIRQQVEADRADKHQFMANPTVRPDADRLQSEMIKRRLNHSPIEGRPILATSALTTFDPPPPGRPGRAASFPQSAGEPVELNT